MRNACTCGQLSSAAIAGLVFTGTHHPGLSAGADMRYEVVSRTCAMTCPSEPITYRSAWGPPAYDSCAGVETQMARLEPSGSGSTRGRIDPAGPVQSKVPLRHAITVTGWATLPPFLTASGPAHPN